MSAGRAEVLSGRRGHRHGWSGPYGPLLPGRLLAELGVLVVAEAPLLRVYGSYDSSFPRGAHFLVGLIAAVAWLAAVLLVTARPARGQVLMALPFHATSRARTAMTTSSRSRACRSADIPTAG